MINNSFSFYAPTKIQFGPGSAANIGVLVKEKNLKRALIVTDKGIVNAGMLVNVEKSLKDNGIYFEIFDGVIGNPIEATIEDGVAAYKKCDADCLVAVGGGSSMDSAKAIGLVITNGGKAADYEVGGISFPPAKRMPFLVACPTTAGTGSEVTQYSVVTDLKRKIKMTIAGENCYADVALLDPELSVGLPSHITAATGMDALTHAIECYTTRAEFSTPMSDLISEKAIKLIAGSLRQAVANGTNVPARGDMLLGSMLAGMAFTNGGLGLVHSLAHQLGAFYDVPHGIANAMILPYVMEYNIISNPQRFADVAVFMGENIEGLSVIEAANRAVDAVKRLSNDVGIQGIGTTAAKFEEIPALAQNAYEDVNTTRNPRITSPNLEAIMDLYKKAW